MALPCWIQHLLLLICSTTFIFYFPFWQHSLNFLPMYQWTSHPAHTYFGLCDLDWKNGNKSDVSFNYSSSLPNIFFLVPGSNDKSLSPANFSFYQHKYFSRSEKNSHSITCYQCIINIINLKSIWNSEPFFVSIFKWPWIILQNSTQINSNNWAKWRVAYESCLSVIFTVIIKHGALLSLLMDEMSVGKATGEQKQSSSCIKTC